MSTLAERFIAAVDAAVELDATAHHPDGLPAAIDQEIRRSVEVDEGLRGSGFEARVTVGSLSTPHPERMLGLELGDETKDADWTMPAIHTPAKDLSEQRRPVHVAGSRFWECVDQISALIDPEGRGNTVNGVSAEPAQSWNEALAQAHRIAHLRLSDETGYPGDWVAGQIDFGDHRPFQGLVRACDDLIELARQWGVARVPTIQERLDNPDVCLSHARIGEERPVKNRRWAICEMCLDLISAWHPDPVHVQRDADAWPWLDVLRANRDGKRREYLERKNEYLRVMDASHRGSGGVLSLSESTASPRAGRLR